MSKSQSNEKTKMKYFVSVKTGDKMNAGTDSNVKLTIIGKSSLEFALDAKSSKKKKNLFEKGNLDEFEFESTDVGKIDRVKIGHDGVKLGSSWYLESLTIKTSSETQNWTVNKWLDKSDGSNSIELRATGGANNSKKEQKENKENIAVQKAQRDASRPKNGVKYIVTVKSGDKSSGANSNSTLTLSVYGNKGALEAVNLNSKVGGKPKGIFERNSVDEFQFEDKDIGKLDRVKIGHDLSKLHLEYISIKTPLEIKTWTVNKVVEKSIPIELKSTEQDTGKKAEPAQKQQKPQPPPQQKPQPPPQQKPQPPPQQKQQPPPQQKPQQQQQQQKQQKESKENLAAQKSQKPEAAASSSNSKGPMKYLITVKTGNKTSAGTDSNVTLTIFGTKTSLQSLRLDAEKSTKKKNLFEKGNVDEFEITGNDVGKFTGIKIGHDGVGMASAWNLESVSIKTSNETRTWIIDKWLDKDDGSTTIELKDKSSTDSNKSNKNKSENEKQQQSQAQKPKKEEQPREEEAPESSRKETVRKSYEAKPPKNTEESIKIELRQLKTDIGREREKFNYPRRKSYRPYVFNDLHPYSDIDQLEDLIFSPEKLHPVGYYTRFTATGIVEPWVAHRMEHSVAPLSSRSLSHSMSTSRTHVEARGKTNLDRPSKDQITGSTLAPNYPKVVVKKPKNLNGPFYFNDVAAIREEVKNNINSKTRFDEDRNRTINDYYRMNLDQTVDNEKMTQAYNAYLSNTPGSKQALTELLNQNRDGKPTSNDDSKNLNESNNKVAVEAN